MAMAAAKINPEGATVMQVVAVPTVKPTEYKFRQMLNRKNNNSIEIIHEIPKATFVDGCYQKNCKMCCPCLFCKCNFLHGCKMQKESSYTYVMENRLEFNRPYLVPKMEFCAICRCRYQVVDMAYVYYYDNEMYDHVTSKTDWWYDLTTFCCGSHGETIKFKRPFLCCPSAKVCGYTVASIKVTEGTAQKTTVIINESKENARAKMTQK